MAPEKKKEVKEQKIEPVMVHQVSNDERQFALKKEEKNFGG